ncbi:radical SAM protein [Cutibacterium sp. WCA-380-WT-3A]|uniref:Radical SAM protein n=1 Tax=Cutibacterium porci TaxID=2605781 RepID=A0A7K0J4W5_9ACTN|nr:radical SAM protein [Cutibacterium porci]
MLGTLSVVVGTACPLKCTYCFNMTNLDSPVLQAKKESERTLAGRWTRQRIKRLVCEAKEVGYRRIMLTGGEPLIYPSTKMWIESCGDLNLKTVIVTSLLLISRSLEECLRDHVSNIEMRVSVGGYNQATHDRYRGGWEQLIKGLELLRRIGMSTHITVVLTRRILGEMSLFQAFCDEWGGVPNVAALSPGESSRVDPADFLETAARSEWDAALTVVSSRLRAQLTLLREFYTGGLKPKYCAMNDTSHVILPDGTLTGCFHRTDLLRGNIFNHSLATLLNSNAAGEPKPPECFGPNCYTIHID